MKRIETNIDQEARHRTVAARTTRLIACVITVGTLITGTVDRACADGSNSGSFDLTSVITTAQPGDVIRVPKGVYRGPVVLDKPVTLIAEPGAVIDGDERGDVVTIKASDVTLRGFVIRGTGISLDRENAGITVLAPRVTLEKNTLEDVLFGIYLKKAPDCIVRHNTIGGKRLDIARRGDAIRLWYSPGCVIEHNTVRDSRDVVLWFSDDITLRHNTVTNGRYGLHFMYSDDNVLEGNRLEDNSVGAFLMYSKRLVLRGNRFIGSRGPSGYGIGLKDMDGVTAENNQFIGNRIGIYIDNSPASIDVTQHFVRNVLAYNDIGVAFQPSVKRNVFVDNTFLENIEQVAVFGTGQFEGNRFTVDGRGNFWSDYTGYDRDGDGIGDIAYRAQSLFENLMDREPKLRLFLFSPAQQAVELAAEALPAIRPRPKLTDAAPLMRPVAVGAPSTGTPRPSWSMIIAGVGLMLASAMCLAVGGRAARPDTHTPPVRMQLTNPTTDGPGAAMVMRVAKLFKRFGRVTAVDGLSFELRHGEALALWGANGAGKTTAIRCILGLLRCRGAIEVGGFNLRGNSKAVRRCLGYVPQELAFYDDWRANELLCFFARLKRVPSQRITDVLTDVGLVDHAHKRIGALSGGMKQRLALAAALLADPPVLVLDEITSNLDASARHSFLNLLAELRARGKAILFTSHRLDEVEALADRVLVLEAGRLTGECKPNELADVLGLRARIRLLIDDDRLDDAVRILSRDGHVTDRNGQAVYVEVSPDHKAAPIAALIAAGIPVRSFDLESGVNGSSPTSPG